MWIELSRVRKREESGWKTRMVFIYPRVLARRDGSGRRRRGANDATGVSVNGSTSHFCFWFLLFFLSLFWNCLLRWRKRKQKYLWSLLIYVLSLRHSLLVSMQHFLWEQDGFKSNGIRKSHRNMFIRYIVAVYSVARASSLHLDALTHITRGPLTAQLQISLELKMTPQSQTSRANRKVPKNYSSPKQFLRARKCSKATRC